MKPSFEMIDAAAAHSLQDYKVMRKEGLDPIPVIHQRERLYWLDKLLDMGVRKLGLGDIAGARTADRYRWLDQVFTRITEPIDLLHGFGMTDLMLIRRYPLFTQVDSNSWASAAYFGGMFVPSPTNPVKHTQIKISARTGSNATAVSSWGPSYMSFVREWVERCGFTWEGAVNDHNVRARVCLRQIRAALEVLNATREKPLRYFCVTQPKAPARTTTDSKGKAWRGYNLLVEEQWQQILLSYAVMYKTPEERLNACFQTLAEATQWNAQPS